MPAGFRIEDIEFDELALVNRPAHAAVLGRIFTSWSLIEGTVAGLLGLMMHADQSAALAILSTFRSNSSRVDAVRKVGKQVLDETVQPRFDTLMKKVLDYAEKRNAVAHNLWGSNANEPDIIYRMPMTALSTVFVQMVDIDGSNFDVEAFVDSHKAQMTAFTVSDLEAIEQQGRDVLKLVMTETTQKGFDRAVEKGNPNAV